MPLPTWLYAPRRLYGVRAAPCAQRLSGVLPPQRRACTKAVRRRGRRSAFPVRSGARVRRLCDRLRRRLYGVRTARLADLVVGDFDSYGGPVDPSLPVSRMPAEKDDTDTLAGLKLGLARGYRDFVMVAAFGGRLDHTIANLQALVFLCHDAFLPSASPCRSCLPRS